MSLSDNDLVLLLCEMNYRHLTYIISTNIISFWPLAVISWWNIKLFTIASNSSSSDRPTYAQYGKYSGLTPQV